MSSSLAKIRLYYSNARERRRKQDAAVQLATLHAIFAGNVGAEGGKGFDFMVTHENQLKAVISEAVAAAADKSNQAEGLRSIQKHLLGNGVRMAHSPLKK